MTEKQPDLHEQLQQECGIIGWQELARHFARGVVIKVDASLDLLAVAGSFAEDDSEQVERWLQKGQVVRASDDDARSWNQQQAEFSCVVAAPWVLVQLRPKESDLH